MSDKKKGFQPPTPAAPPTSPQPTGDASAPPAAGSRSEARDAARRGGRPASATPRATNPLERYRLPIIGGAVVVGLLALAAVYLPSATAAPYTCATLMTPPPATPATPATPAGSPADGPAGSPGPDATPAATPRLGFAAQDLGSSHVSESTSVAYAYCPPTSGTHFNSRNAPLARRFYGPDDALRPGNWLHNLEHGYAAILYKGEPDAATLDRLRTIMEQAPGTDFSTQQCGLPNKVIVARFDDMTTPFAAVSWDHALLLPTFDATQLATYVAQSQETDVWPEKGVC